MTIHIAHHLAGSAGHPARTRIRVPREHLAAYHRVLEAHPGVQQVISNPVTGSVLVHHSAALEDIVCHIEASALSEMVGVPSSVIEPLGPIVLSLVLCGLLGYRFVW